MISCPSLTCRILEQVLSRSSLLYSYIKASHGRETIATMFSFIYTLILTHTHSHTLTPTLTHTLKYIPMHTHTDIHPYNGVDWSPSPVDHHYHVVYPDLILVLTWFPRIQSTGLHLSVTGLDMRSSLSSYPHIRTLTHIHTPIHTRTHSHTLNHTHTHTHIHTHTHT